MDADDNAAGGSKRLKPGTVAYRDATDRVPDLSMVPDEVMAHVANMLDTSDQEALGRVSRRYNRVVSRVPYEFSVYRPNTYRNDPRGLHAAVASILERRQPGGFSVFQTAVGETIAARTLQMVLDHSPSLVTLSVALDGEHYNGDGISFTRNRALKTMEIRADASIDDLTLSSVDNLRSLETITISGEDLVRVPAGVFAIRSLRELTLENSIGIRALPGSVENLKELRKISLRNIGVETLPDELCNLGELTELDVVNCGLMRLPDSIWKLAKLVKLRIQSCRRLVALPWSIGHLSSLEHFILSDCGITGIPRSFGELGKLFWMSISDCENITTLPDAIGDLENLGAMFIENCDRLNTLPATIGGLRRLQRLDVTNCANLTVLPREIGSLGGLRVLGLRGSSALIQLPTEIGTLTSLEHLDISMCRRLTFLPTAIGGLTLLEDLDISHCERLESLPASIGDITDLLRIDAHDSGLRSLPGSLRSLRKLRVNLKNTQIESDFEYDYLPLWDEDDRN